jgi:hypothetical protein
MLAPTKHDALDLHAARAMFKNNKIGNGENLKYEENKLPSLCFTRAQKVLHDFNSRDFKPSHTAHQKQRRPRYGAGNVQLPRQAPHTPSD